MIEDLEENEFEENDFDQALRPKGFDDFQGQDQIVDNLKVFIDFNSSDLTPGNFLSFNKICEENKINTDGEFLQNLEILLNLYRKNKNINLINMILFSTDCHFHNLQEKKIDNIGKIIEDKSFVISNINKFIAYNLNQNSYPLFLVIISYTFPTNHFVIVVIHFYRLITLRHTAKKC